MAVPLFALDDDSALSLQQQIRQQLLEAVLAGALPPGARLPSSRQLARQLGVARNTVFLAYQQLIADGQVQSRERSGLYVSTDANSTRVGLDRLHEHQEHSGDCDWAPRLKRVLRDDDTGRATPHWRQYPFPLLDGLFDDSLFPAADWREASRLALGTHQIQQWSTDSGDADDPLLMEELRLRVLLGRGIVARPEELLLTMGARQALDLVTQLLIDRGTRVAVGREVDEDATMATPFFRVDAHADKVRIACARYPRRVPPGTRWVYHTTDTYLLGTSMQAYWRRLHGANADFFRDALVDGLYAPLGLSPAVASTRRTYDAIAQPFTGWGLMLLRDDIAKLALFMVSGTGELDGQPVVNRPELSAALQRSASDTGFSAARPEFRYNNGLWAWNAAASLACKAPLWVPFMSGYGGISVVLMPNGAVYYYFSDNSEFRWARALREANKLAPFCTG